MRDFIKQHPWRLEIVPFAIVILAFVIPVAYRQDMLANLKPWHGYNVEEVWLLRYVLRGIMVVGFWLLTISMNDSSPYIERKNVSKWSWSASIVPVGAGVGIMTEFLFAGFSFAVILIAGWLQSQIERTCEFRPRSLQTAIEKMPSISIKPGEPFYYREERKSSWWAARNTAMALLFLPGLWTMLGLPMTLLFVCFVIYGLQASREIITVSHERVTVRANILQKTSILISLISECSVYDYEFTPEHYNIWLTKYDGMILCQTRTNQNVRIETTDGKAYLLVVKDPEGFCKLIEMARSHRRD